MSAPNIEGTNNPVSLGWSYAGTLVFANTVPFTVATGNTVTLNQSGSYVLIRTTADGTIAGAVINLPLNPADGQVLRITSTGTITAVTGTVNSAIVVPPITTLVAGVAKQLTYNAASGIWFQS